MSKSNFVCVTMSSDNDVVFDELIRMFSDAVFIGRYNGEKVIIKLIHEYKGSRATNEAKIIKRLENHVLIPKLLYFGDINFTYEDEHFIKILIMEYIEGPLLSDIVHFDINSKINIALQLCGIIQSVIMQGLVHNDIKDDNIIYRDGLLYLIDFDCSYSLNWEKTRKLCPPEATLEDAKMNPYYLTLQFEYDKLAKCINNFLCKNLIPSGIDIHEMKLILNTYKQNAE